MVYVVLNGPYVNNEGRRIIFVINPKTNKRQCISYARYLMAEHLGELIDDDMTVDHINNNCLDDRIENFQLLSRIDNARKSIKPEEMYYFDCPICKKPTFRPMSQVKHNWKNGKQGPYCSRRCAGKVHN